MRRMSTWKQTLLLKYFPLFQPFNDWMIQTKKSVEVETAAQSDAITCDGVTGKWALFSPFGSANHYNNRSPVGSC